jgi:CheY-like chemotaxis protein
MSKILLIDDDEDMLAMTSRWLSKAGYDVTEATSGKAALDILKGEKPDLILLDYAMPEMDGPAVLSAIRSDESTKNIPVLYRTGMEDGTIETGGAGQANGIVPKSDGKPGLMRAVENLL